MSMVKENKNETQPTDQNQKIVVLKVESGCITHKQKKEYVYFQKNVSIILKMGFVLGLNKQLLEIFYNFIKKISNF